MKKNGVARRRISTYHCKCLFTWTIFISTLDKCKACDVGGAISYEWRLKFIGILGETDRSVLSYKTNTIN